MVARLRLADVLAAFSTGVSTRAAAAMLALAVIAAIVTVPASAVANSLETYRDEYVLTTDRGTVVLEGEHASGSSRWVRSFDAGRDSLVFETVVIGPERWERMGAGEWQVDDDPEDAFRHPFTSDEVTDTFEYVGPGEHEGLPVELYQAEGPVVVAALDLDPTVFEAEAATVAIYAGDMFARYQFDVNDGEDRWASATYRVFDAGADITIERPPIEPEVVSCRDWGVRLVEELGSFRSRYELLHDGAAISSIEELHRLDADARQWTVRFRDAEGLTIDTLWVNGGFSYWRETGGAWQEDMDGSRGSLTYRPFVDDLWLPDVVDRFDPIGEAEVAGRSVEVYELGLDDVALLNPGLTRDTDALSATFWVEPCWTPELIALEVTAAGRGYVDGEFHVRYELLDFATSDTIDIPPEVLGAES